MLNHRHPQLMPVDLDKPCVFVGLLFGMIVNPRLMRGFVDGDTRPQGRVKILIIPLILRGAGRPLPKGFHPPRPQVK